MAMHPSAIIEDGAEVHASVEIGPWTLVEAGAVIDAECRLESCVRIYGGTRLGPRNRVCHGATLGSEPQDLSFTPERGLPLTIGSDNCFREYVNISRGVKSEAGTCIGSRNYFMAFSHAGHDCKVGDDNILANTATLAGHVELAHHCFVSGQVAVHQFARIGAYTMIGGLTGVSKDIPPFMIANGQRAVLVGLNLVGLKRNGFTAAQRARIKAVYRLIFRSGQRLEEGLHEAKQRYPSPETDQIVAFIEASERGVAGFG
ncbi:MAG: acyl-ACP--UDP-N-acetylglucosamine O-acyltransferase [Chromatiaceae bacterium]|nr:acyl-ACP--UDP-N-acetylglucosamine O-acyltransferase [Chromatiaceae bacterium]MCF7994272.1 acyl-ACP--UDP-N-acetylglucosamine O-acyltransferase [Chromatiaceae bacterium]MCF8003345.1 acyl-ACP--UDP-N-acetylglucosamine O-acyltransferase [Chromatiaceae bacterium]MCF8014499.1 acyl-ACP--UDP-N-acetylglucosamine O-acyltransferase [Chromatiaceae bacterium]